MAGQIAYTRPVRLTASGRDPLAWLRWGRIWFLKCLRRFGRPGGPFAEKGLGQNKDPSLNLRRYGAAFGRLTLDLPVVMIAQKMLLVPIIKCCFQEEPGHAEVSHLLETPVGCVHAAAHDGEFTPRHLLA